MENKASRDDSWRRSSVSPEALKDRDVCMSVDGELMKRQDLKESFNSLQPFPFSSSALPSLCRY